VSERGYVRPNALQWLRYAYGGSLPARNREWVLHDVTTSTWALRHIVRSIVQLAPLLIAVLLFLPASLYLRILTDIAAGGPAILIMVMMIIPMSEHRLIKAGYPGGLGQKVRSERAMAKQRATAQRFRERSYRR
jgi:hypothetical protein